MGYRLTRVALQAPHAPRAQRSGAWRPLLAALLVATLALPAPALAFGEFSIKDEEELGKKIKLSIRGSFPVVEDPEVIRYINSIVVRLTTKIPPQPFDFSVNVIRHNAINAFAMPGGNLFVFTGLILAMEHEAELSGVLAHEMAHATQRHIAGRIEAGQKISILSAVGALAGLFLGGANMGPALMAGSVAAGLSSMLKYSRGDEGDADQVGMTYLLGAGYPPQGMVGAFEKLSRQQMLMGSTIPTYLATHPALSERISQLGARIRTMPASVRNRPYQDDAFHRIQTLIRARYADADQAMNAFNRQEAGKQQCLAYLGKGILLARLNRVNDATVYFDQALACNSRDALNVREAGIFHYLKGDPRRAGELLPQAVSMDPKDGLSLFFYARMLADNGNIASALGYYREVLRQVPDDPEVYEYYSRALGQDKQMCKAYLYAAYAAMYAGDRKRAEKNYVQAKGLAQSAQDKDAVKRFEDARKERKEILGR